MLLGGAGTSELTVGLKELDIFECALLTDAGLLTLSGLEHCELLNLTKVAQLTDASMEVVAAMKDLRIGDISGLAEVCVGRNPEPGAWPAGLRSTDGASVDRFRPSKASIVGSGPLVGGRASPPHTPSTIGDQAEAAPCSSNAASERELELRGRAGWLHGRRVRLEPLVRQDLDEHIPLRDHRDQTPQGMADSAEQNLHIKTRRINSAHK